MSFQPNSTTEFVWLRARDSLPNVCCSCGMYTDHRVWIHRFCVVQESTADQGGCGTILLLLFMHLALGPIGWLISILSDSKKNARGTKLVKKKIKFKISQCLLCAGTALPQVIDVQVDPPQLLVAVHPQFFRRLDEKMEKPR